MATFPSFTPTYNGYSKKSAPVKRLVRFADGYEHRVLFGLASHQNPKTFTVQFNESEQDADVIEAFLDSRANDQASFTFTPTGEGISKTGTYSQSGTTITVTKHGVAIGETVTLDYTSGSATDGSFIVASSASVDTFTVTAAASATNSGNVTVTVSGAKQYVCENWTKTIPYNNRVSINLTFEEVFEP